MGDPNGIGPEVVLKSLAGWNRVWRPLVVGSAEVLRAHAEALGVEVTIHAFKEVPERSTGGLAVLDVAGEEGFDVQFGQVTEEAGRLAVRAIEVATDLCIEGKADAMVTAPISKEAVRKAGFAHPGHTEFIGERTGSSAHAMMMVAGGMRVGLVSGHLPLREVPDAITPEAISQKLRVIDGSLQRDFGIETPRIAVLGLNPHAGDGGMLGREEIEVIAPALEAAREEKLRVEGPFSADGFFGTHQYEDFDAVLAMYHDQGLVPFKALAFGGGVNFTAGLPIVRTSPDHGTAFDIAGEGCASPESMQSALQLACSIVRQRLVAERA